MYYCTSADVQWALLLVINRQIERLYGLRLAADCVLRVINPSFISLCHIGSTAASQFCQIVV